MLWRMAAFLAGPPRSCQSACGQIILLGLFLSSFNVLASADQSHIDDYMGIVKTDQRLPRYERLRDHIAAQITGQTWRPGDLIPSESELATSHNVSIGTVRKAIDRLVAEGLLERQQGRGTYVRRAQFNSSLFRFFRFRSEAGERTIPQARILHRKLVAAPAAPAAALRLREGDKVINISRLRLIDGEPLLAEEIWLDAVRFSAILELDTAVFGDLLYPLYEEKSGPDRRFGGRSADGGGGEPHAGAAA